MDKKIANRLAQLRREKGYSQEQAAAALFVSRQAVSKWERGESAPDTDNLVALSKLYGMSIDQLLFREEPLLLNQDEPGEDHEEDSSAASVVYTLGEEEDMTKYEGIFPQENSPLEASLPAKENSFYTSDRWKEMTSSEKIKKKESLVSYPLLVTVVYLLLGFVWNLWHPGWIVFLTIPLRGIKGRVSWHRYLASPTMIVILYLLLGFYFNLWHPGWLLFLCIPLFNKLTR